MVNDRHQNRNGRPKIYRFQKFCHEAPATENFKVWYSSRTRDVVFKPYLTEEDDINNSSLWDVSIKFLFFELFKFLKIIFFGTFRIRLIIITFWLDFICKRNLSWNYILHPILMITTNENLEKNEKESKNPLLQEGHILYHLRQMIRPWVAYPHLTI